MVNILSAINSRKLLLILLCVCVFSSAAQACTAFIKKTTTGDVIYARTNEFGVNLHTHVLFVPRKISFHGTLPDGSKGASWQTKYAMIGVAMFNTHFIVDGINEKGLGLGSLYLPKYTKFTTVTPQNKDQDLASWQFGSWILGQFATVDQVKTALSKIHLVNTPLAQLGNAEFPLHFMVFDKTGKAIVIESINGKLKVYDDPVGVITNAPTFDWHLINLKNYVNLTATNVSEKQFPDMALQQFGQGSGLVGLPGDFSPPSRFVRTTFLSQETLPATTAQGGVITSWNIIENINIPKGTVRAVQPDGRILYETTQDTVVYDIDNKVMYFRDYDNPVIRMVDMKKFDPNGKQILSLSMNQKPKYEDLANQLKPVD